MTANDNQPLAFSVGQFCTLHDLSRQTFYNLPSEQRPATFRVGRRRLVSVEAAAAWRRMMEQRSQAR